MSVADSVRSPCSTSLYFSLSLPSPSSVSPSPPLPSITSGQTLTSGGTKCLKQSLYCTLPFLTLFKPKPHHFRQIFHILSGPPSSLMDQALAVCLATSSTGIFLFLAQKNHRSLLLTTAGICCPVAVLSSVWLVVLGQVFSSLL